MRMEKVSLGRQAAVNPATIDELFEEHAAFSLRERGMSPDTVKERRLYLGRIAA